MMTTKRGIASSLTVKADDEYGTGCDGWLVIGCRKLELFGRVKARVGSANECKKQAMGIPVEEIF